MSGRWMEIRLWSDCGADSTRDSSMNRFVILSHVLSNESLAHFLPCSPSQPLASPPDCMPSPHDALLTSGPAIDPLTAATRRKTKRVLLFAVASPTASSSAPSSPSSLLSGVA